MSKTGEKILSLRKNRNMTQAELGKELNISAQAVSKWEKGLSEPDIETSKHICKLFNITMDELVGITDTEEKKSDLSENENKESEIQPKIIIGYCSKCKKPLYQQEDYVIDDNSGGIQKIYCKKCNYEREYSVAKNNFTEHCKKQKNGNIWGIIAGSLVLIIVLLVGLFNKDYLTAFLYSTLGGIVVFTIVTQMFWGESVADCLMFFVRSFKMPGLIFTLDIDGIIWFITVKLGLMILSAALSLAIFAIGLCITSVYSVFCYPIALSNYFCEKDTLKSKIDIINKKIIQENKNEI